MQSISTIGLDITKSVFQVHGVDAAGQVVMRRQLRRRHDLSFFQKLPPCLVHTVRGQASAANLRRSVKPNKTQITRLAREG
jgi:transposase